MIKNNQYPPVRITDADMEFLEARLMNRKKLLAAFCFLPIPAEYFDTNYASAKAMKREVGKR